MAFPFIFQSNFETGDASEWDSETDTVAQLDIPSYKDLAALPYRSAAPFSGSHCMRLSLTGGTADAFLTEADINIALATQSFFKFLVWFSPDFTATADDTVNIFEAQSGSNVAEITFGARIVAATGAINFGIGKIAPTSFTALEAVRGAWYTVEIDTTPATGGAGTIDVFITKEDDAATTVVSATQVGSLTNLEVTHGVLGMQDHLATTTGVMLVDDFVQDDARIFPATHRFTETVLLTKSGHAFVGNGTLENVSLLSGAGADNVLTVFDTDSGNVNDTSNIAIELKNTANNEIVDPAGAPVYLHHGCFIQLAGTNPRALTKICKVSAFGSAAAVRKVAGVRQ